METEPSFAVEYSSDAPLAQLLGRPIPVAGGAPIPGGIKILETVVEYKGISQQGFPLVSFEEESIPIELDGQADNIIWRCVVDGDGQMGVFIWQVRYRDWSQEEDLYPKLTLMFFQENVVIVDECPQQIE